MKEELNELWKAVAGPSSDSEEEEEQVQPKKVCVNPPRKRKENKDERSPEECIAIVEQLLAIFEVAAEDDAELNRQEKPCINKLKKLPLLIDSLSKKHLQKYFIDHGVFTLLKNWLEPLPDGSLPNTNIRQAILFILTERFHFDVNQFFVRKQLQQSGLGKAIMFLSQSYEETAANRKLALDLVYKWSRGILNISARYEDTRCTADLGRMHKRPCFRKPVKKVSPVANDDDLETKLQPRNKEKGEKIVDYSRAKVPEPTPLDFIFRPRPRVVNVNRNVVENERQKSIMKKCQKFKSRNPASRQIANRPLARLKT